jgi:hypothetical protein
VKKYINTLLILVLLNYNNISAMEAENSVEKQAHREAIIDLVKKSKLGYSIKEENNKVILQTYQFLSYDTKIEKKFKKLDGNEGKKILIDEWIFKLYEVASEEEKQDKNIKPVEEDEDECTEYDKSEYEDSLKANDVEDEEDESEADENEYNEAYFDPVISIICNQYKKIYINKIKSTCKTYHLCLTGITCEKLDNKMLEISALCIDTASYNLLKNNDVYQNLKLVRMTSINFINPIVFHELNLPVLKSLTFKHCTVNVPISYNLKSQEDIEEHLLSLNFDYCNIKTLDMSILPKNIMKLVITEKTPEVCNIYTIIPIQLKYLSIIMIGTNSKEVKELIKGYLDYFSYEQLKKSSSKNQYSEHEAKYQWHFNHCYRHLGF